MKWLAVLLTIGLAYGQDLPAQLVGVAPVACPEALEGVTCFPPTPEAVILANAEALGVSVDGWHDRLVDIFAGWDVTEPDGAYRYLLVAADPWLLITSTPEGVAVSPIVLDTQP